MVERRVGQLSLADGLVETPNGILDKLAAVVDWVRWAVAILIATTSV